MQFKEILQQYNIPFREHGEHEHTTAGFINFDCPWCSPGWGHYRMGYSLAGNFLTCWSCGGHQLTATVQVITRLPFKQVKNLLSDIRLQKRDSDPLKTSRGHLALPGPLFPLSECPKHKKYLIGRGFDPAELEKLWKLSGTNFHQQYGYRLVIPIDFEGETVSFSTRLIDDGDHGRRYRTASPKEEALPAKRLLYGEDYARHKIIVVEGFPSVWRIGPGSVATMGTSYTRAQVLRIAKYPVRALLFDNEVSAQKRARKLCNDLEGFDGETYRVTLDDCNDPADAPAGEIRKLRKAFLE
jgi:hypothetical protein